MVLSLLAYFQGKSFILCCRFYFFLSSSSPAFDLCFIAFNGELQQQASTENQISDGDPSGHPYSDDAETRSKRLIMDLKPTDVEFKIGNDIDGNNCETVMSEVDAIHDEGAAVKDEPNGQGVPVIADLANTAESCRSFSGCALRLHSPTSNETVENSTKRRSKTTNRSLSHRHAPYTTPIKGTRNDKLQNQSMHETTLEDIDIPEVQIVELSRKLFCLLL